MGFVMTKRPFETRAPETDYAPGGRPLTGWKVLAIFVGLFGVVAGANAVMIYEAVKTFRGEVVAHPYERGLAYNRDIAESRAQDVRDWRVDVAFRRDASGEVSVTIQARTPDETPITGVDMSVNFVAPADVKKDASIKLVEAVVGRYEGRLALPPGLRDLVVTARRGGKEVFRSTSRVAVE